MQENEDIPNRLGNKTSKNLTRCERSSSIFLNTNTKILNVAISELKRKLNRVKNNLCATKMIIEGFNLGELCYKNTIRWIEKIAIKENWKSRKRLQKKLKILKHDKLYIKRSRIERKKIKGYLMPS